MMKYLFFWILALLATIASAQQLDSIVIKQVDSLILVSRDLTAQRDFDQALAVNAVAEQIALEAFGSESASYGSCAFNRGRVNYFKGNNSEAEKWYLRSKESREKTLGREHPDYVGCLNNLALLYMDLGNYEKAEAFYLEAKEIREKTLGPEHPDYASSLNNLALLYMDLGNYEKAGAYFLKSKEIREKTLGREHPDYAHGLNNLAVLYFNLGNYERAESYYLEAKEIREKTLGREHPDYASSLGNLAILYMALGNYEKAEVFYLESNEIREKTLGREHPDYAWSLNNLGGLYFNLGNYEKAGAYFLESKEFWAKTLGREHPNYAGSLNNLASISEALGNYEKAEAYSLEAKEIREKALGREHPDYALNLNNLAVLYFNLGNYEKAEAYWLEAKEVQEKTLGREHPDYVSSSLNGLATLYLNLGNYEKAEAYWLEAIEIQERSLGREHPDYASSLGNLAILYRKQGNYEKAEAYSLEAKEIRAKTLGPEHPSYASSLNNLAILYKNLGNYEKAEAYYLEAKEIREKTLGRKHPEYANSLNGLSTLYETQFRYTECTPILTEALALSQTRIASSISFLSERELAKYAVTHRGGPRVNAYLLNRPNEQIDFLPALSYDQSLFTKGFLMQAAARLQQLTGSSPQATAINSDLKGYRRRIAQQLSLPIAERKGVMELEEKANALEKELARTISGYAEALRQVQWQDVQDALSMDAAALEFVHFQVNYPQSTDSTMYAALLLRQGATQPTFIPLFEEKEFEHLLAADKERKADYVNELYAWADRGMIQLGSAKKSLYDLIWAKIEAVGLEGIKTIYYSPSGVLHRLNLGAIAIDDEAILSDRYNLVALNSTRQLVIPSNITTQANDALLVGGVNFEVETTLLSLNDKPLLASRSASEVLVSSGTRGGSWSYLKWTEKEVERITTSLTTGGFDAAQLSGSEATEEAIKAIGKDGSSPRVLHIATHGFFFPDPEVKIQNPGSGETEPVFKSSDNPMIRSGLILAGGNYAWQQGRSASPDKEDGILTAYEISQMNLANTELVVLSACETGLGEIQGNEGVYGLQRAFKIAGAKYLIMSLWQVPDRETMEFMTTFYRNWLEENMTIPEAFRKTQREMRDRFFNPYSWAGFVLVE